MPYHDRQAIESGALAGRGLEIVWLESAIDAFFIHVQGSARVRLTDGLLRLSYAGKSGHDYTPIGGVLRDRRVLQAGGVTMASIRAWLAAHPDQANEVMWANRSFIFFRETADAGPEDGPIAAAGVPLSTGRSLAVDRTLHTFHAPIFVETTLPDGAGFRRLMVAQDTGSAIAGPARGDIFFGSGDAAGAIAGAMQSGGRFYLLAPVGAGPEMTR
jgi:membrane-bound lytic murein transglycosylase A